MVLLTRLCGFDRCVSSKKSHGHPVGGNDVIFKTALSICCEAQQHQLHQAQRRAAVPLYTPSFTCCLYQTDTTLNCEHGKTNPGFADDQRNRPPRSGQPQKSSLSRKSGPSRVRPDITPAAIAGPCALGLIGLAGATAGSVHPHYMVARLAAGLGDHCDAWQSIEMCIASEKVGAVFQCGRIDDGIGGRELQPVAKFSRSQRYFGIQRHDNAHLSEGDNLIGLVLADRASVTASPVVESMSHSIQAEVSTRRIRTYPSDRGISSPLRPWRALRVPALSAPAQAARPFLSE